VGDGGQDVLADLFVAELRLAGRQSAQRPNPGVRVHILDLIIREGPAKGSADHGASRRAKLLVQTAGALAPDVRLIRTSC
jgi:hypothetical protein